MNFCIVNLGCKVNRVESDAACAVLLEGGGLATSAEDADLIVVNTCTVTGEAEKKTRKAVRRALRDNAHAPVLVTGCACAIDPEFYEDLDERIQVIPKSQLYDVLAKANTVINPLKRVGEGFPTRVGVKVQDGCDNACTFCIVHFARGHATSRPSREVIDECVALAQAGVKEIVLTGINLGSYYERTNHNVPALYLEGLLRQLLEATENLHAPDEPPCRFRISSIEPADMSDSLISLLATAQGRICRHLHLPLQSGSDKVLHEMARPYDASFYMQLVEKIREANPFVSLSTDVIVGFPGETEDDFQATLDICASCGFSKIHVFPYSRRAGTPAAARADQVPAEVKAERSAVLRALGDELRSVDFANRFGKTEYVVVEEGGRAMTESYYEIDAPAGAACGSLVEAQLPRSLR